MSGETEQSVSGWTTDTLKEALQRQLDGLREELIALGLAQTTQLGSAVDAQQTAMRTAFEAADRAVQAALLAADRAVLKAEVATERRLEGLNEFREQLADVMATLMPRGEFQAEMRRVNEQAAAVAAILATLVTSVEVDAVQRQIQQLTERVTGIEASARGEDLSRVELRARSGQVWLGISVILAAIAIVVTLVISRGI